MDLDKIKALEKKARELEPGPRERQKVLEAVTAHTEAFLEGIDEAPAYEDLGNKGIELLESPIDEDGVPVEEAISLVQRYVDGPGLNPASGRHLGFIPGGGVYYSALGDLMAAVSNRYAGVFFSSPGAVRMENMLLNWMAGLVDYPNSALGNISSGGSIANLTAIVTARDAHELKSKDLDRTVIYATSHVHHCLNKALRIAGLGECILKHIAVDGHYRMDPQALEEQVTLDREQGLLPWLLVGSAGTTNTGAIDPLDALADVADKHQLWFHVDGAYGAFFLLCEEERPKFRGIERSDSVVMDPHKGLFLPYGSGVVLVREGQKLYDSHVYLADYMQDAYSETDEHSPANLSPELTKHFRGLRIWLPLKLHGIRPFRSSLQEKLELAHYLYERLEALPRFEVGSKPDLSVVIFRYVPENGDPDRFNEKLTEVIREDGNLFFSSTRIDGTFYLRAAILSFRTHLDTIDELLTVLREKAAKIEEQEVQA